MKTKTPFWRFLATATSLVLLFPGLAVCQQAGGAPADKDVTQIDYSNNHGGFNVFSPYSARFVPAPRLDNTRRVTDLISDGKLMLGSMTPSPWPWKTTWISPWRGTTCPLPKLTCCARRGEAQRVVWQVHISPPPSFPAVWAEVWAAAGAGAEVLGEAPSGDKVSTAWVEGDAVIRVCTPSMVGRLPPRP